MFAKPKPRAAARPHLGHFHPLRVQGVSLVSERCVANWYPVAVGCSKGNISPEAWAEGNKLPATEQRRATSQAKLHHLADQSQL